MSDPRPPEPRHPGETPPVGKVEETFGGDTRGWRFNPEYERLVEAWNAVMPHLEHLRLSLDKAYNLARSPQTWDAPVGERYVHEISEWRTRLALYRYAVLTVISDEAAGTPRWVMEPAHAQKTPHAAPK